MFARVNSYVLNGIGCDEVEIESDQSGGLHNFILVGLPDVSVREAKERVGAAIKNSGLKPPHHFGRITVCLAPSDLRKTGSGLDLPIAISILEATGQIPTKVNDAVYIGALSLDGKLRKTSGILPMVIAAKEKGYKHIFIPRDNLYEARLVQGIRIIPLISISDYARRVKGGGFTPVRGRGNQKGVPDEICYDVDISDIKGQEKAKRALLIIAAGAHNMLMYGPPGSGKTMLARSLPSILPRLSPEEALEVTKIYSVAGLLPDDVRLMRVRPFRSPHHTASGIALIGGGTKIHPGEITLAHRGVLFLDELLEHSRRTLDNLRQPVEEGFVTISRSSGTVTYPSRFIFIGATNPCPCGYAHDPEKECRCTQAALMQYRQKLSGPIIDRIDVFVEVQRIKYEKLCSLGKKGDSHKLREQVQNARNMQIDRFSGSPLLTNADMRLTDIQKFCQLKEKENSFLKKAVKLYHLSVRAYCRILKIARTIADLEGEKQISQTHIAEAIQYRITDM